MSRRAAGSGFMKAGESGVGRAAEAEQEEVGGVEGKSHPYVRGSGEESDRKEP